MDTTIDFKTNECERSLSTTIEINSGDKLENVDSDELDNYIRELHSRLVKKEESRVKNQNITYSETRGCSKLDSSLKRNTAFVRKIKTFTESQLPQLVKELSTLNIEKYISEIVSGLIEAKLKLTDIPSVIILCSQMHEQYADFSKFFFESWQKVLVLKKEEKVVNISKLRVDLRFYSELISHGIFTQKDSLPLLGNMLTSLVNVDRDDHQYSSILLSFCKYCGEDYAGLVPKRFRQLAEKYQREIPRSTMLPPEKQKTVKILLCDYYSSLCNSLLKEYKDVRNYEKQSKKILQTKGELSAERKEKFEKMNISLQKLQTIVCNYAEVLDEDQPTLPLEKEEKNAEEELCVQENTDNMGTYGILWDDEDTKKFYECMPDIKEFIPPHNNKKMPIIIEINEQSDEQKLDEEFVHEQDIKLNETTADIEDDVHINCNTRAQLDTFLSQLPNCVNKEMIDNAAIDFLVSHNNRSHRKRLVKTLFNVPRTRLDLLPLYARLVTILNPVMPDVTTELVSLLKNDFKYHVRKKDQINIETKIKIIRFIGELVKFNMYPRFEGIHCLKLLLNDFTHHHIEMACNLLECAGKYFYRNADTRPRTKVFMEQMMRKKSVMNLDNRYVTMIENAYYYVSPPEVTASTVEKLPTLHQFIRKILYTDLNPTDEAETRVLNIMKMLDWNNKETTEYAIRCLTQAWNIKYPNIKCLANLLAGLVMNQEFVGTRVVDGVIEDIRIGLEINATRLNQRRVAMIKYFGELYNYRIVESTDVFNCLYTLISFSVSESYDYVSILDPPDSTFRIRLVCILLETCGQYFNHGLSRTKLDYFLVFFQKYYWMKYEHPIWTDENPFPFQIKFQVRDILSSLRPHLKQVDSFEVAKKCVEELRSKLQPKIEPLLKKHVLQKLPSNKSSMKGERMGRELLTTIEEGDSDKENEEENGIKSIDEKINSDSDVDGDDVDESKSNATDENERFVEEDIVYGEEKNSMLSMEDYNDKVARQRQLDEEDKMFAECLDRMLSEEIQDRSRETIKPQHTDISVPYNVRNNMKKNYEQLTAANNVESSLNDEKNSVNFIVLLRKGNKQQYKNLEIPLDSDLAKNLKSQEKAERVEMEKVKRLTLDINERLEEEDYQDHLQTYSQKQAPTVTNREKKKKYQHPKGVPDVDLIFGKKRTQYK